MNELAAARHTRDVGHDIIAKDETTREDIPKHTIEDVVHEVLELPYGQTEYLNSVRNRCHRVCLDSTYQNRPAQLICLESNEISLQCVIESTNVPEYRKTTDRDRY